MRVQRWKVPAMTAVVILTASCGREAESAAANDDQRLVPGIEVVDAESANDESVEPLGAPAEDGRQESSVSTPTSRTPSEPSLLVRTEPEPTVAPREPMTVRPGAKPSDLETEPNREPTPQPERLAVMAGAQMVLSVEEELSTEVTRTGDAFDAVVSEDVLGSSGMVLVPRGTRVRGVVLESTESQSSEHAATLALGVERVELGDRLVPVVATVTELEHETEARDSDTRTAAKVGAGAVGGAILGKILGGDGGDALKGAVAGAAVGAAVAHATRSGHAKIPEGARMVIVLDEDLVVEAAPGGR
jgi:hypothetical protein